MIEMMANVWIKFAMTTIRNMMIIMANVKTMMNAYIRIMTVTLQQHAEGVDNNEFVVMTLKGITIWIWSNHDDDAKDNVD